MRSILMLLALLWLRGAIAGPAAQTTYGNEEVVAMMSKIGSGRHVSQAHMREFLGPHNELESQLADELCRCRGFRPPVSPVEPPDDACLLLMGQVEERGNSLVANWLYPHLRGWSTGRLFRLRPEGGRGIIELRANDRRRIRFAVESSDGNESRRHFDLLRVNGRGPLSLIRRDMESGLLCRSLERN